MSSKQKSVVASGSSSGSKGQVLKKRAQIEVACNACRRRKTKCDGQRPACKDCSTRNFECSYDREPGEGPLPVLKRKLDALEAQRADEHELLERLRTVSYRDAIELLAQLRSRDIPSALQKSRSLQVTGITSSERPRRVSHSLHRSDPQYTSTSPDASKECDSTATIYPNPDTANTSWTLPIDPLPPSRFNSENTSRHKVVRRAPSVPDLSSMRMPRLDKHAGFISQPDPRLNEASAAKWGASFLTDHEFRMLLTAYFVWDHQGWAVFDSDDFCGALTGASSELSSRLLVLAVLTQAARIYVYFDAQLSLKQHDAWSKTLQLWEASVSCGDDSIATACAAAIMCGIYGGDGNDKKGKEVIARGQRILLHRGLFDRQLVSEVYGDMASKEGKTRALAAWGMYDMVTYLEFCTRSDATWFLPEPPVPVPTFEIYNESDTWHPWPLPRLGVPSFTNQLTVARAQLSPIFRAIASLQLEHGDASPDLVLFDASIALHDRLLDWMLSVCPVLKSVGTVSPHLILLHIWYRFGVLTLFRPFAIEPDAQSLVPAGKTNLEGPMSAFARDTSTAAAKEMRELLVRHEALYGGLGIHVLLATPILSIAYDAMPTASPTSANYSLSAHMGFLTALRALVRLSKSLPALNLIILGLRQSALRSSLSLPLESDTYFHMAMAKSKKEASLRAEGPQTAADWVVDFTRSTTDLESARLDNLVMEMSGLQVDECSIQDT